MPDLYLNWRNTIKLTQDTDGVLVLWNRDQNPTRTRLAGRLHAASVYDLTPADATVGLAYGDLTTLEFLYLEADFSGMGWKIVGSVYNILNQSIPGQPATAQIMTESIANQVVVSATGTTGGRLSYLMIGT